jgi:hypothetical protein
VNSWEAHQAARRLGSTCFQGEFFLKPQLFRRREIAGTRLSALNLLRAILKDLLDLSEIESVVREEPALAYKLLRYLNSPIMDRPVEVRSIRNAISLLGDQELRRWASLVAVVIGGPPIPRVVLASSVRLFLLHRRDVVDAGPAISIADSALVRRHDGILAAWTKQACVINDGPVWTAQALLKLQLVSKRNQDGWSPDALPIDTRRAVQNETG